MADWWQYGIPIATGAAGAALGGPTGAMIGGGIGSGILGTVMSSGPQDVQQVGGMSDADIEALRAAEREAYEKGAVYKRAQANQGIAQRAAGQGTAGGGMMRRQFSQGNDADKLAASQYEAALLGQRANLINSRQFSMQPTQQQQIGRGIAGLGGTLAATGMSAYAAEAGRDRGAGAPTQDTGTTGMTSQDFVMPGTQYGQVAQDWRPSEEMMAEYLALANQDEQDLIAQGY